MTERKADISPEALQVFAELQRDGIVVPTVENYLEYRQNLLESGHDYVGQTLSKFDIEIEDTEIAGISCKQQTPPGWSPQSGLCVLYAYGGGYVSGSSFEDQVITVAMSHHARVRVVSVDYRLSPEHPYPEPQQDMQTVYVALLEQYGADRLIVSGESAGGNQALGLLLRARDQGIDLPRCAVMFSPWVDLTNQGDSHRFNDDRDPTLNNAWVDSAAGLHAAGHPLDDPGISPLYGDMHGLPPCLITTGSCDLLLSQCLRLAAKLRSADISCDLRVWEGMWHVFEYYPIPEAETSILEVSEFIKLHC